MKANIWLLGAILAGSTLVTTAHADNATRVAATSALEVWWVLQLVRRSVATMVP